MTRAAALMSLQFTELQLSTLAAIGLDVWYLDHTLPSRNQPRPAKITGPGSRPGCFNLVIFMDKVLDVTGNQSPPVITRKNVLVLSEFPESGFPLEPFAVTPASAMAALERGLAAARAQAQEGGDEGQEPPKPAPKPQTTTRKPEPAAPPAPPPKGAQAAPGKTAPEPDVQRGPINKLLEHPAWDRELGQYKGRQDQNETGLDFMSKTGIYTARVDFVFEGQGKPGYRLKVHEGGKGGKLKAVLEGVLSNPEVRKLSVLAARTAVFGQDAGSPKEAAAAWVKAKESFENPPPLAEDEDQTKGQK
jgi:hypothetical protein